MVKKLSIVLMAAGVLLIGYSVYQLWKMDTLQEEALQDAETVVATKGEKKGSAEYFAPKTGDAVGILRLPRLQESLPIVEGVTDEQLARGVGHYAGTAFPTEGNQIVLSGHRDTVFTRLGELKINDELEVEVPYGTFTYVIERTEIVPADDRTVIRPTAPEEVLTVTTCYPFGYIGDAPDRYIIHAKRKQD
nr:class D sortase [Numidum massiliense]